MRITFRVTTASDEGYMALPLLKHPAEYYADKNLVLDEAKVREELRDNEAIQFSSNDNRGTLSLVVEFLDRTKISLNKLQFERRDIQEKKEGQEETRAERRMRRGKFACVRLDISFNNSTYKVSLQTSNPTNAVGEAELFAGYLAQTFADTLESIKEDLIEEHSPAQFVFKEGDGCEGMFEKAKGRVLRCRQRTLREHCERRVGGFCSPCDPSCPFLLNGKCGW